MPLQSNILKIGQFTESEMSRYYFRKSVHCDEYTLCIMHICIWCHICHLWFLNIICTIFIYFVYLKYSFSLLLMLKKCLSIITFWHLCVSVCLCVPIWKPAEGFENNLTDSLFKALPAYPIILVAESQVAMTPDCFVCPLTPLRGALVNQALPMRGQPRGERWSDISSLKMRYKRFYTSVVCRGTGTVMGRHRRTHTNKRHRWMYPWHSSALEKNERIYEVPCVYGACARDKSSYQQIFRRMLSGKIVIGQFDYQNGRLKMVF